MLANVDGLNDYDEDFTDAALVVKGLKSAYQVGKGYLTAEDEEGRRSRGRQKQVKHPSAPTETAAENADAEGAPAETAENAAADA